MVGRASRTRQRQRREKARPMERNRPMAEQKMKDASGWRDS